MKWELYYASEELAKETLAIFPAVVGFILGVKHGEQWYESLYKQIGGMEDPSYKLFNQLIFGITYGSIGFMIGVLIYGLWTHP